MAVDVGAVTNGSAGQWLSGTLPGAVSEYQSRTTVECTREAQAAAIARRVASWPGATVGYRRDEEGRHIPDPETKPILQAAFDLRADGASIREVRDYMREHGLDLSYGAVQRLLSSRVVLGEIHFGDHKPNLKAHESVIDRETLEAGAAGEGVPRSEAEERATPCPPRGCSRAPPVARGCPWAAPTAAAIPSTGTLALLTATTG